MVHLVLAAYLQLTRHELAPVEGAAADEVGQMPRAQQAIGVGFTSLSRSVMQLTWSGSRRFLLRPPSFLSTPPSSPASTFFPFLSTFFPCQRHRSAS